MQINLLVSSGDLPDMIVRTNWKGINGGLPMWEEDGVILDLTELMPEYMPNYMALIEERDAMSALLVDGKLYYISGFGKASAYRGPLLRGDWLTALAWKSPPPPMNCTTCSRRSRRRIPMATIRRMNGP